MFFKNRFYEKFLLRHIPRLTYLEWSCTDPSQRMYIYKDKYEAFQLGYVLKAQYYFHYERRLDWIDKYKCDIFHYSLDSELLPLILWCFFREKRKYDIIYWNKRIKHKYSKKIYEYLVSIIK